MKITLVHPCIGRLANKKYLRAWQMEPLPMAHLAGLTNKSHQIEFFDDRIEQVDYDSKTDLVAISTETYTAKRAYQIATRFRERGVPVVMGGFHATLMPDEVSEYAEAVVVGEAEGQWHQVLEDAQRGMLKRIYKAEKRPDITIAAPDRSIFKNKNYLPVTLLETARGCTFKCEFCAIQSFFKSTQNRRDHHTVIEEIRELKKKTSLFFFVDDNVVSHVDQFKEFLRLLIPLKIRWVGQATITMTHDTELLELMNKSGCQGVLIGFESLNKDNLKLMNKSFNASRGGALEAIKKLEKYGIRLYATFIFGYPNDSEKTFGETLQFCLDHKIFMVAFNHLTPFPGTPLYQRLEQQGLLLYDKWWLDDDYRYGDIPFKTEMSREKIRELCQQARKDFYSYKSIVRRLLSRSNAGGGYKGLWMYLFINFLLHHDTESRYLYPLGDPSFQGSLLKAQHSQILLKYAS